MNKQINILPNGISLAQIKKDAKKLKNIKNITHNEALSIVIKEKTSFSNINKINSFFREKGQSTLKLKIKDNYIVFYEKYNVFHITTGAGQGKTAFALNILKENPDKKAFFYSSEHLYKQFDSNKNVNFYYELDYNYEELNVLLKDYDYIVLDLINIDINSDLFKYINKTKKPIIYISQLSRAAINKNKEFDYKHEDKNLFSFNGSFNSIRESDNSTIIEFNRYDSRKDLFLEDFPLLNGFFNKDF